MKDAINRTISAKHESSITKSHILNGGDHTEYTFQNGRGASVIHGGCYARGLELAVLDSNGSLDYSTEVTDDVLGYLSDSELDYWLDVIKSLPSED